MKDNSPFPDLNNVPVDGRTHKRNPMILQKVKWPQLYYPDFTTFFRLLRILVTIQPFEKHSDRAKDMLTRREFVTPFMLEAMNSRKAKDIVPIFVHICTNSPEYSEGVIATFRESIKLLNSDQLRPYFRTFLGLIDIQDQWTSWRIKTLMEYLVSLLHDQERWWKVADMLIEHLIRFAKRSSLVIKWLKEHPDELDWIANWLKQNPKPPLNNKGEIKSDRERADTGVVALYHDKYECYCQNSKYVAYGLTTQQKQIQIDLIKNGDLDSKDVVYDSDEGLDNRQFKVEEKIDCLDTDLCWLPATVLETSPYKGIFVKYDGWSEKWNEWIPVWSPRITKLGTLSQYNPPPSQKKGKKTQ